MSNQQLKKELASFERWMEGKASGIDFRNCAFFIRRSGISGFEGYTIAEIARRIQTADYLISEGFVNFKIPEFGGDQP